MTRSPKLVAVAVLAVAFFCGAAFGAMATSIWSDGEQHDRTKNRTSFTDMLTEELSLTEAQSDRVAAIVEQSRPRLCELWRQMRPRYQELRTEINTQIRDELTDEQKEAFDVMITRGDSASETRRRGRGGSNGC